MKAVTRHTNTTLMNKIFEILESMPEYARIAAHLNYRLAETYNVATLTNYDFDVVAAPAFGSSEGIYVDCFINGKFDNGESRILHMGTLKTLETSLEAMRMMGELCGLIIYTGYSYINKNLALFTPGETNSADCRVQEAEAEEEPGGPRP
jgi:hypothetical protein